MTRLLLLLLALSAASPAAGQSDAYVSGRLAHICPALDADSPPPGFDAPDCSTAAVWEIDPQGRLIWARLVVEIPQILLERDGPLGVFISGKMSSAVWVNGAYLGANGRPGADRASEIPGRMDAVLYLPRETLQAGENEFILLLSSHHGSIRLAQPVQWVVIGDYGDPGARLVEIYWPSLITLGAFVLAVIFFGVSALRDVDRPRSILLALMALSAGGQLLAEAARGVFPYAYPLHDVRLVAIVFFASLYGLLFTAYLSMRLSGWGWRLQSGLIGGLAAAQGLLILVAVGFDAKTAFALVACAVLNIALCAYWGWRGTREAWMWMAALIAALIGVFVLQGLFLDLVFYYLAGGLLLLLVAQQAQAFGRERRLRQVEAKRAGQLEIALDQARQRAEPAQLSLTGTGKMEKVSTDRIAHLKAAGDYVEIRFIDGRTVLHTGALSALEQDLPASFLRVHRSHIVNTAHVRTLERDASGVGRLTLSDGGQAPVSRRVMPKVRKAMAAG